MTTHPVHEAIRALLAQRGQFRSGELVELTGLSRQALSRHLARAVEQGSLVREGRGRATRYRSPAGCEFDRAYSTAGLREEVVADELLDWLSEERVNLSPGARGIVTYAVSELVNNAIDHSQADTVEVRGDVQDRRLRLDIVDAGIGAFETLRSRLHLEDHVHALQELSKGKTTTQPERHSGEGLFFTSKMAEQFRLAANGLCWVVDNTIPDQTVQSAELEQGTRVHFEVSVETTTTPAEVFERYTHDFEFDTTRCVIRLFERGVAFVSRSEAKRLVANLERFREVVLDFHGVQSVGQGFVDEVFRVWARQHPDVRLVPEAMNREVEFMVRRGLARAEEMEGRAPPR